MTFLWSLPWQALPGSASARKLEKPETEASEGSTAYGVWVARCSMIAVFSLPLFAAWAISDAHVPSRIRVFRLGLTLVAAFCMGIMVFLRQHMLDRELIRLLNHSQESFDNLKRLQAQILQSESLASIGQLVGGAAHELNNPITAMLGYSDMLLSTALTAEQQPLAAKIGQYVRRTKSLVASLISFARQAPAPKTALDLNTLARTAVKWLSRSGRRSRLRSALSSTPHLPKVMGDSNQLLHVCLQLVANSLHLLSEGGGRLVTVSTERQAGLLYPADCHRALPGASEVLQPTPDEGLALSACQGMLQEHHGQIVHATPRGWRDHTGGSSLPASSFASGWAKESTVPVLWQSRPFA